MHSSGKRVRVFEVKCRSTSLTSSAIGMCDRPANSNIRKLVRCFDTCARYPLDFPVKCDLRRLRGMVHDIVTYVDFSGPGRFPNINRYGSDIRSD